MQPSDRADTALAEARRLQAAGRIAEAEAAFRRLADRHLRSGRPGAAVEPLAALSELVPDSLGYCARLATLLDGLGRTEAAIAQYRRLLARRPALAAAHFNLALLYKKEKCHGEAIAAYEDAIRLGIDGVEEAYSNLGVLYSELRRPADAMAMYRRALEVAPDYLPALFNLAGLLEESGERERAAEIYDRILAVQPGHAETLSRLAYGRRIDDASDPLLGTIRRALDAGEADPLAREGLWFALGKALDDLGRYEEALDAYRAGNELGRRRNPPYDRAAAERAVDGLIRLVDRDWIERHRTDIEASPIFICGMLRSGSTLTEQILAAHPQVTAGGELDILPWLIGRRLSPYPQRLETASAGELEAVGRDYLDRVHELFPAAAHLTDKRPDNFLHLGLVRALFPRARIVHTRRRLRDNCLSIYFQRLGGNLSYATDLGDAAHYYRLQERLMAHWQACFPGNLHTVDYDELVRSPEPVLRRLLEFLGLPWEPRCLEFHRAASPVQTASLWQVREALHTRSSGRWRHYEPYLDDPEIIPAPSPR